MWFHALIDYLSSLNGFPGALAGVLPRVVLCVSVGVPVCGVVVAVLLLAESVDRLFMVELPRNSFLVGGLELHFVAASSPVVFASLLCITRGLVTSCIPHKLNN